MSEIAIGWLIFCIPHIVGILLCAWAGFLYHITEDDRYKKLLFTNDHPFCFCILFVPILSQIMAVLFTLFIVITVVAHSCDLVYRMFLNVSSRFSLKQTLKNSWFVKSSNWVLESIWIE